MKHLISFFVLLVLACASTPDRAQPQFARPTSDGPVFMERNPRGAGFIAPLADGGTCVLTPPRVERAAELGAGLLPPGHPGGALRLKCAVSFKGEFSNCRVESDTTGVADSVIKRVLQAQATPAACDGHPIDLDYVFQFEFRPE